MHHSVHDIFESGSYIGRRKYELASHDYRGEQEIILAGANAYENRAMRIARKGQSHGGFLMNT
jgi:hypothetical protein